MFGSIHDSTMPHTVTQYFGNQLCISAVWFPASDEAHLGQNHNHAV